ncbi:RNA polymerase I-specific transcription initiation factor RRN3 [Holothuria leucospilota]|uniref:RNA polymerase I-specific transcription initiation factor RRN3 n=1 Tax=Holothuria leucospilota TaxID=206669 RepID=A0A9Q1BDI9_HOLLE|nr:RNA polymerase I-specific transcription initiation factor RRN3 [Holothuria leucospilota]
MLSQMNGLLWHFYIRYQGDAANYKRLLLQLQNPRIEPGVLIELLNQLEAMTFLLTHQYESLVVTVLRIDWVSQNIEVQKAYKSLIVSLVSAQPTYLHHVLHSLVVKLSPETFLQSSPDSSNTAGNFDGCLITSFSLQF